MPLDTNDTVFKCSQACNPLARVEFRSGAVIRQPVPGLVTDSSSSDTSPKEIACARVVKQVNRGVERGLR